MYLLVTQVVPLVYQVHRSASVRSATECGGIMSVSGRVLLARDAVDQAHLQCALTSAIPSVSTSTSPIKCVLTPFVPSCPPLPSRSRHRSSTHPSRCRPSAHSCCLALALTLTSPLTWCLAHPGTRATSPCTSPSCPSHTIARPSHCRHSTSTRPLPR